MLKERTWLNSKMFNELYIWTKRIYWTFEDRLNRAILKTNGTDQKAKIWMFITREFIHRHHNKCLHVYSYCYMFRSLKTIIRQNSWDYKNHFYLTSEDLYWCTLKYSFVWIDFPMCVVWVYSVCVAYLQIVKIRRTGISMITNSKIDKPYKIIR
jgi:hypothetical protein